METKKKALGKGLEQLFATNEPLDFEQVEKNIIKDTKQEDIVLLDLKDLRANPYQPRKHFEEEAMQELAESVKLHGVIQPIIVKQSIKGYEIVAGERRVKAAEMANLTNIPAIVRPFTDEQMMEIALLENLQRENLNPVEEAEAYQNLITTLNLTQDKLATRMNKSRSHITNMLGILKLPKNVQNEITKGKITLGHAKVLSKLDNIEQISELTERIIKEDLSVRALEKIASSEEYKRKIVIKKRPVTKNLEYNYAEELLMSKLDTKVTIKPNKIEISFSSSQDLKRILEILDVKE